MRGWHRTSGLGSAQITHGLPAVPILRGHSCGLPPPPGSQGSSRWDSSGSATAHFKYPLKQRISPSHAQPVPGPALLQLAAPPKSPPQPQPSGDPHGPRQRPQPPARGTSVAPARGDTARPAPGTAPQGWAGGLLPHFTLWGSLLLPGWAGICIPSASWGPPSLPPSLGMGIGTHLLQGPPWPLPHPETPGRAPQFLGSGIKVVQQQQHPVGPKAQRVETRDTPQ